MGYILFVLIFTLTTILILQYIMLFKMQYFSLNHSIYFK